MLKKADAKKAAPNIFLPINEKCVILRTDLQWDRPAEGLPFA